ncbi:TPA: RHS domain-containing protein [Acinetobacter baumannii]|nr:RHS domain-containing protein [Acinetobacter baumannii]
MVEYRYDALGRRIQKRSKHHHTGGEHNIIYGWDGDTLAYESTEELTKHYIYEKDSFVPMLQAVYLSPIKLHQIPDWSDRPYNIHRNPLWKTEKQGKEFDDVWFYHCDHLGTPQEMTDHTGAVIWKAEYKAWGECKAEKAKSNFFEDSEIISNNIRFQGQYFDQETGLHYNRYRYYSPYVGRFISKDPIGLLGGDNVYAYAPNPVEWLDPLGLSSNTRTSKNVNNLPPLKGKSIPAIQKILKDNNYIRTNPTNPKNQRWKHQDDSEVQIHAYGNNNTSPHKSGNNAHVHKSIGKHGEPNTIELADDGVTQVSTRSKEAHIGIKNPKDFCQISGRNHGD